MNLSREKSWQVQPILHWPWLVEQTSEVKLTSATHQSADSATRMMSHQSTYSQNVWQWWPRDRSYLIAPSQSNNRVGKELCQVVELALIDSVSRADGHRSKIIPMLVWRNKHCYCRNNGGNGPLVTCPWSSCISNLLLMPRTKTLKTKLHNRFSGLGARALWSCRENVDSGVVVVGVVGKTISYCLNTHCPEMFLDQTSWNSVCSESLAPHVKVINGLFCREENFMSFIPAQTFFLV